MHQTIQNPVRSALSSRSLSVAGLVLVFVAVATEPTPAQERGRLNTTPSVIEEITRADHELGKIKAEAVVQESRANAQKRQVGAYLRRLGELIDAGDWDTAHDTYHKNAAEVEKHLLAVQELNRKQIAGLTPIQESYEAALLRIPGTRSATDESQEKTSAETGFSSLFDASRFRPGEASLERLRAVEQTHDAARARVRARLAGVLGEGLGGLLEGGEIPVEEIENRLVHIAVVKAHHQLEIDLAGILLDASKHLETRILQGKAGFAEDPTEAAKETLNAYGFE